MITVESGTFTMGCSTGQRNCEKNETPHSVTLSSFSIGKYEVTQGQWKLIMGNNPSLAATGDDYPVDNVDAQEFITRLNTATGKQYRLPTEAEWEYAARGGAKTQNYLFSSSNNMDNMGWYRGGDASHPVGGKLPNELGIYDMSGNVWEWCSDWYAEYIDTSALKHILKKDKNESIPLVENPAGTPSGEYRVFRDGSWSNYAAACRVSYRYWRAPHYRSKIVGFRLALSQ